MVKGMSDQNPLPPWMARSTGFSPGDYSDQKDNDDADKRKAKGSGNQRSLQLESATPMRAKRFCGVKLRRAVSRLTSRPGYNVKAIGHANENVR